MLVLSRKTDQEIIIGQNVKVTVLQIKGNTVRLGIDAPREVRVVRGELPRDTADCSAVQEFTLKLNLDQTAENDGPAEVVPFKLNPSTSRRAVPTPQSADGDRLDLVAERHADATDLEPTKHRVREILALLTRNQN